MTDGWIARLMDGMCGWMVLLLWRSYRCCHLDHFFTLKGLKKATKSCITFNGQTKLRLQRLNDWTAGWPYGFNLSARCESLSIYRSNYERIIFKYEICL